MSTVGVSLGSARNSSQVHALRPPAARDRERPVVERRVRRRARRQNREVLGHVLARRTRPGIGVGSRLQPRKPRETKLIVVSLLSSRIVSRLPAWWRKWTLRSSGALQDGDESRSSPPSRGSILVAPPGGADLHVVSTAVAEVVQETWVGILTGIDLASRDAPLAQDLDLPWIPDEHREDPGAAEERTLPFGPQPQPDRVS